MNAVGVAKRLGMGMLEVLVKDFIASGYIALFNDGCTSRSFRYSTTGRIYIKYTVEGKTEKVHFTVQNLTSLREETVVYTLPKRSDGTVEVLHDITKPYTLDFVWLTTELAKAMIVLHNQITITGERQERVEGGKGYSVIAADNVAEQFTRMRNNGTPGVAN